jgi:NADH:ubiquinone oxidoreductase subunit 3 (subunit A)
LISSFFYLIGLKITPKVKKTKKRSGKLEPYACGEAMPARKFQMNIQRFFLFVTIFMIFDISVFILALSFSSGAVYPIIFSAIIASSLLTIIPVIGRKRK